MKFEVVGKTDVGLKRSNNEDAFFIATKFIYAGKIREQGLLAIVADGMGGHKGGEVASSMAVHIISEYFYSKVDEPIPERIKNAIRLANEKIYEKAATDISLEDMGTTVVLSVVKANKLYVANVGDSRCYIIRNNQIEQITEDHSLVAELVKQGLLTKEEAENSAQRNIITRSVGNKETVEPQLYERELKPGDIVLLCTDGLSGVVKKDDILDIVVNNPLKNSVEKLIEKTLQNGAPDNVTLVLIKAIPSGMQEKMKKRSFDKSESSMDGAESSGRNKVLVGVLSALLVALMVVGAFGFYMYESKSKELEDMNNKQKSFLDRVKEITKDTDYSETMNGLDGVVKYIEDVNDTNNKLKFLNDELNDELKGYKMLYDKGKENFAIIKNFFPGNSSAINNLNNNFLFVNFADNNNVDNNKIAFIPYKLRINKPGGNFAGSSKTNINYQVYVDNKWMNIEFNNERFNDASSLSVVLSSNDDNLYFYYKNNQNSQESIYYVPKKDLVSNNNGLQQITAYAIQKVNKSDEEEIISILPGVNDKSVFIIAKDDSANSNGNNNSLKWCIYNFKDNNITSLGLMSYNKQKYLWYIKTDQDNSKYLYVKSLPNQHLTLDNLERSLSDENYFLILPSGGNYVLLNDNDNNNVYLINYRLANNNILLLYSNLSSDLKNFFNKEGS